MKEKKLIRTYDLENNETWELEEITTRDFLDQEDDERYLDAYEIILEKFFQLSLREKEMILATLRVITEQTV